MTKGERIVAEVLGTNKLDGYPKLTEEHHFFGRLRAFMSERYHWLGTATDLLTEMNDTTTPPNTVTKLLNKFCWDLYICDGIDVSFKRTNRRRIIELYNYQNSKNKR